MESLLLPHFVSSEFKCMSWPRGWLLCNVCLVVWFFFYSNLVRTNFSFREPILDTQEYVYSGTLLLKIGSCLVQSAFKPGMKCTRPFRPFLQLQVNLGGVSAAGWFITKLRASLKDDIMLSAQLNSNRQIRSTKINFSFVRIGLWMVIENHFLGDLNRSGIFSSFHSHQLTKNLTVVWRSWNLNQSQHAVLAIKRTMSTRPSCLCYFKSAPGWLSLKEESEVSTSCSRCCSWWSCTPPASLR